MQSYRALRQKDILLDLLSIIARRPSHHCLQHPICQTPIRNASTTTTSPSPPKPPSPKPSAPSPPPLRKPTSTPSSIPLRMLLDSNPSNTSAISKIPIPSGARGEQFTPSPLSRPIGLPYPPRPGQNAPHSNLTWLQRQQNMDREQVQAQRRVLVRTFLRPYFQEWKRLEHWKGKSFVGNERLFRRERALWFPNLWGWTLRAGEGKGEGRDTTPVLKGKISLVGVQSGVWAEEQVGTFLGEKENPELGRLMAENKGLVQRVDVNIQDHWFRAWLVRLFKGKLRKGRPESEWGKYFVVRLSRATGKGLTEDIRDAMGLLNSQVGYVYLVDTECRIRWAGSGHVWEGEVNSLNSGVRKLVQEAREKKEPVRREVEDLEPVREGDLQEQVEKALA